MGILLLDRNLQRNVDVWISNTGSSVNPVPSDYFGAMASGANDGTMVVTNGYNGDKQYPGGLISNKRPFPKLNDKVLPYVGMRIRFKWGAEVYPAIARHELDLKVCFKTRPNANTKIRNVANFSTQWNSETGAFQLDHDPPAWVDSGLVVPDIPPNVWHDIDYRFWYDPDAAIFSILSINLDGDKYMVPEEHQNIPAQETNWEEVASVQIQNEIFGKGSSLILYDHVTLAWSDEPIGDLRADQLKGEGFGVFLT